MVTESPIDPYPAASMHPAIELSGPIPAAMPVASAWEWGALIAVALDGRPLVRGSAAASDDPPRGADGDRAVVALVALLAAAAVVLSALLV